MRCPFCQHDDTRVIDTRVTDDGTTIRRRRECSECHGRFTTTETASFSVEKRSGVIEPFSRDKITTGVRKACQGRPVSERELAYLAHQVEDALRATGQATVSADEVGRAILPFLRQLDEVAYLRFASVYSSFQSLDDFDQAIADLRADKAEQDRSAD
ncbi:MAG: transcriptional regulator NrdR [Scrofimicrobium sp.]